MTTSNQTTKKEQKIVAAFDFDGTITMRDTLLPFLIYSAGKAQAIKKLAKLSPKLLSYFFSITSRQEVKEHVLKRFFGGMPMSQLEELGEAFAKSDILKKLIYVNALKRLEWHKRQKHRCILVSASIDAYLRPWAKRVGFDDLICSKLEVDRLGVVTGSLEGKNCWGDEKSQRLEALLGPKEGYTLYAYGDSRGDHELLDLADHPFYRKMPTNFTFQQ